LTFTVLTFTVLTFTVLTFKGAGGWYPPLQGLFVAEPQGFEGLRAEPQGLKGFSFITAELI
ncbi:MAG: hypothetical protein RR873_07810, partial [Christensenella sp.]